MTLKNITLELSGKAFRDESEATMYLVCRNMFKQWRRLIDRADRVSVMLWIADGSEILEYTGNLDQTFEWAYWIGCANPIPLPENYSEELKKHTHFFPKKYFPEAGPRPYSWLKRLIEVIRETGTEQTGKPVRIGAIFDNGPEFALSDFKYKRHREIAQGSSIYPNSFVTCNSTLHADPQPYAGFPEGIPEGISLGEFLGKQYQVFARDLGYDYIWLSNGMGFGMETWGIKGALFDKKQFYPEKSDVMAETMLKFWRDFTNAAPGVVIETRGSNFSSGVEIATDAAPLREIYHDFKIAPPVNSPWAALNFNSGLELAAWMSHVAELPTDYFPFRFYTHDPWFLNSPWLDRYGREPWDIFLPLSICRINSQGETEVPNSIAILTVDDTYGRMPDQVPNEVIPHLFDAMDNGPDMPGPLLWIYPFDEYNERRNISQIFNEDMFLGETIQNGLPLNSVISTGNFRKIPTRWPGSIMVAPLTAVESCFEALTEALDCGCKLLAYGSLANASERVLVLLGLGRSDEITGEVTVCSSIPGDVFENNNLSDKVYVFPQFDGGGLVEIASGNTKVVAEAVQNSERRVIASLRQDRIAFLRSLMPCAPEVNFKHRGFDCLPPDKVFPVAALARHLLAYFGWKINALAFSAETVLPRTNISRHDNAFYFSIYSPDTSADLLVNTPLGAPLLKEMEIRLKNGDAVWRPDKCWHKECRCFVKQQSDSVNQCKYLFPEYCNPEHTERWTIFALDNAEVRFFPPSGSEKTLEIFNDKAYLTPEWEDTVWGRCIILKNISGSVRFEW